MKVRDKIFVVTGAGGGIGGELCLELLARGARVAATDHNKANLAALKKRAGKKAALLSTHVVDITDAVADKRLPKEVARVHGTVDGLINCAGVIQPFKNISELDDADIARVMSVNFTATLTMTRAFLPVLLDRPEAHIANVSSMGGFLPVPGQSIYGASKAAVKLFSEGLYAELLGTPVHVSVIFPGATNTNITENSGVSTPNQAKNDIDKVAPMMLPAHKAAKIMINGIERNRVHIYTGIDSKMMNALSRISPTLATRLIAKLMSSLLK